MSFLPFEALVNLVRGLRHEEEPAAHEDEVAAGEPLPEQGKQRSPEARKPVDGEQQRDARQGRQHEAHPPGEGLLATRQPPREDRDEDDVVDPQDHLKGGEGEERDPRGRVHEPRHAAPPVVVCSSCSRWRLCGQGGWRGPHESVWWGRMREIDGSQRSGSGTIVRTAVALAALLGEELRVVNVRARRNPPGLRPQHLRAVEAVAEVCGAQVEGAEVGSQAFTFRPSGHLRSGRFVWDIGTAGSATLLAMTVLPVAAFGPGPSTFRIRGGLFQDFAPSAFHLQHVVLPMLGRMGIRAELEIVRPGYVSTGGGIVELRVQPTTGPLRPLDLQEQGAVVRVRGIALASHLRARRVGERMAQRCAHRLRSAGLEARIEVVNDETAPQPGAALAVFAETTTGVRLGADRAGAPGRPSEAIADDVARMLLEDLRSGATVDRHFADQLVVYAALAEGTTEFRVPEVTDHVDTNLWLVQEITGAGVSLDGQRVRIRGIGYHR